MAITKTMWKKLWKIRSKRTLRTKQLFNEDKKKFTKNTQQAAWERMKKNQQIGPGNKKSKKKMSPIRSTNW